DYDFNKYNSFSSNLKLNWFQFSVDGFNLNENIINGIPLNFQRNTNNENKVLGYDWNNDFTHKFKKEGQEVSFAWQLSKSNLLNDYDSYFSNSQRMEIGNSDAINKESTFQLDYTHPFKKVVWEAGVKAIMRDISNDSGVDSSDFGGGNSTPV